MKGSIKGFPVKNHGLGFRLYGSEQKLRLCFVGVKDCSGSEYMLMVFRGYRTRQITKTAKEPTQKTRA